MFKKMGRTIGSWLLSPPDLPADYGDNWNDWLDFYQDNAPIKEEKPQTKEKDFFIFADEHLVKVRFEASKKVRGCSLRCLILELDGRPILSEEQTAKAQTITSRRGFQAEDQRALICQALAAFSIDNIQKISMVDDEDFVRQYRRLLHLRSQILQKKEKEGDHVYH